MNNVKAAYRYSLYGAVIGGFCGLLVGVGVAILAVGAEQPVPYIMLWHMRTAADLVGAYSYMQFDVMVLGAALLAGIGLLGGTVTGALYGLWCTR